MYKRQTDELIQDAVNKAKEAGCVTDGDLVVVAAGIPVHLSGSTNMLKVHVVGDVLVQGKGMGNAHGFGNAKVVTDSSDLSNIERDDILVVKTLDKNFVEVLDKVAGIISEEGGLTSHLAVECVSRNIPLITNAGDATTVIKAGTFVSMDVNRGVVYAGKANLA